jgi:DNA-binding transcriptional MerR regulator
MKIGEFSQVSRTTIKTLRYYDQIGLLKPQSVDAFTGHRHYSLSQLHHLNRILALKALGLTLEQIQNILFTDISDAQLSTMLMIKKAELLQTLADIQQQIEGLDNRIQYVMQEGKMPEYEVIVKSIQPQRVLSIRQTLDDGSLIEPLLHEIYEVLEAQQIESVAEWMTLYHHEGFRSDNLDVEVAIPIGDADVSEVVLDEKRKLTVRIIDGHETLATVIEQGNNETWSKSYYALSKFLEQHEYELLRPTREVYITDANEPSAWLVEIQYPVTKVANPSN